MTSEFAISAYVLLGGGAAVAVAFSMPALTSGGATSVRGISQDALEAAQVSELGYCRSAGLNVNCACFAQTSGMIMAYDTPQAQGYFYLDKKSLARGQAKDRC